ncbi:MAG: phage head-tail connector protein [Pseudomonadota bacterium]
MTQLTVIVPPDEPAVLLASAKDYLRIGHSGEDDLIVDLVEAATKRLEQIAGLALVRRTLQWTWLQWPQAMAGRGSKFPISTISNLTSVILHSDDSLETDITARFQIECGRLRLRPWSMLPGLGRGERVEIQFEAGFGGADEIPEDLQEAVLRLVASIYSARSRQRASAGSNTGIPHEVQAILNARREVRL